MRGQMQSFAKSETGAVTVDWVVLTAAIVGIGVTSVAAVRTETAALGNQIDASMTDASIARVDLPYVIQGLTAALVADRTAVYQTASTAQIIAWHRHRAESLVQKIAKGNNTHTGNWSNLIAGETLDIVYLHRQELVARGAYPVDGVPDFDALHQMYRNR